MASSIEMIYEEAMRLPDESKALLAERLVEYLETHVDPDLERLQLDIVKRRREEMRERRVEPVEGHEALGRARRIINK
jgi:hypothetical protein